MKKLLVYYGCLLLLISCNQKGNLDSFQKKSNEEIESKAITEQYIEDEALLAKMESDLILLSKNPEFIIEKELVNNRHVDKLIDTIKTFKVDKVKIKSYKTASEEWIFEAKILNSTFELLKSIKVGIHKSTFEKTTKIKLNADIVKVGNLEQTSVFQFTFKNDSLKEIDYEGYVD